MVSEVILKGDLFGCTRHLPQNFGIYVLSKTGTYGIVGDLEDLDTVLHRYNEFCMVPKKDKHKSYINAYSKDYYFRDLQIDSKGFPLIYYVDREAKYINFSELVNTHDVNLLNLP